jgi:CheY-like chemotaxis protein
VVEGEAAPREIADRLEHLHRLRGDFDADAVPWNDREMHRGILSCSFCQHILAPIRRGVRGTIPVYEAVGSAGMHTVVIVNGHADAMAQIESVIDAGHYDTVFVESSAQAYSQIKRIHPNLVILFLELGDTHGFQMLSMLKLDQTTRDIRILTSTVMPGETEVETSDDTEDNEPEEAFFAGVAPARLN